MKTSCIRHPESTRYIQLHEWQVSFCQNHHCAALILAYFIAWHDWKLRNDQYYRRSNDIAEMHGDGRPHNQNAYLFFSTEELIEGCMGLYGKKTITDGLDILVSLNVISVHKNPNPRYHFDKTKYFQFYPRVCNEWIADRYPVHTQNAESNTQVIEYTDRAKMTDRKVENELPSSGNDRPSGENRQAITNTTINNTNQYKPINACKDDCEIINSQAANSEQLESIITLLISKGMPADRLKVADDLLLMSSLIEKGASASIISQAYDASIKATAGRGNQFGIRYLAKVIDDMLHRGRGHVSQGGPHQRQEETKPVYENDFSGGMNWMGDLVE